MKPDEAISEEAARWVARCDAGLSTEDQAAFDAWLAADARHRKAVRLYGTAWSTLASPAERGKAETMEDLLRTTARRRRRRLRMAAFASVATIALLVTFLAPWSFQRDETAPSSAIVMKPERQALPDGSSVEIKAGTRIQVLYSSDVREIRLDKGEAHFVVAKNADRPFVVTVGAVKVRAVGTEFSVGRGKTEVEVLVTEGRVSVGKAPPTTPVADPSANRDNSPVDAGTLMVVALSPTSDSSERRAVPADEIKQRLSWRNARLEFTRTPLREAVEMMNAHSHSNDQRLVVSDPSLGTVRISGVFRADNIDAFVMLLEGAFGVRVERQGSTLHLHKAGGETDATVQPRTNH